MEQVAEKIFEILNNKFNNPDIKAFDADNKNTTDISEAKIFSFDFIVGDHNYGPVVILLSGEGSINIYYGDNTGKTLDSKARDKWDSLLRHLSSVAQRNRLGFSPKNIKHLRYDISTVTQDVSESYKKIFEGYYGTSKTSYKPQGQAKIIIKHSKKLGEEDARFRNISHLFIENSEGERFKLPFRKLAGARAMARHVSEGGNPYDLFGQHICEIVKDINTLGGFLRSSKAYEHLEETAALVETGREHYDRLRKDLNRIAGKRGYHTYRESWQPHEIPESDKDVESIRDMFMEKSINSRIEEALPLLARLQELAEQQKEDRPKEQSVEEPRMKEINEFEEWANTIVESDRLKELQQFFAEEQPLGIDAINASESLEHLLDSDELMDALSNAAASNPDADARPIVAKWIRNNDSKLAHTLNLDKDQDLSLEGFESDLDVDDEQQLNASINKDLDKYRKDKTKTKEFEMKDLNKYMDEIDNTEEENKQSQKEEITESKDNNDEEIDMKRLIERTNYLLQK